MTRPPPIEQTADAASRADAVALVVKHAHGGLRFHDLGHSSATWLISNGVPVNDVQAVMGHQQASTTHNRYTHRSCGQDDRVRNALADYSLTSEDDGTLGQQESPSEEGL